MPHCPRREGVVGRSISKDVNTLSSRICDSVTLNGKRDFVDISKIIDLKLGRYLGLSWWTQSNHTKKDNAPLKAEEEGGRDMKCVEEEFLLV